MTAQIFFNETELNGKYQVLTTLNLEGKGIKNYGGSAIVEYNGEIHKENKTYWVSKSALENIKNNYKTQRTCF